MKPTSVVFIVISAILIVVGVILCVVGGVMAKNEGVELFSDYIDDEGNAVTEYDISGRKSYGVSIDLDEAEILIVGNAERNFVKVENYPVKAYDYWMSEGTVNFRKADILTVFKSFRISESGFGFNGLRHYLALGKYKDKTRRITVYLSEGTALSSLDVSLKKGSVTFRDVSVTTECSVSVDEGSIFFSGLSSPGKIKAVCGTGNISFSRCNTVSCNAEVTESGNILCETEIQYSYTLKCISGGVYLDSVRSGSEYSGVYPSGDNAPSSAEDGSPASEPAASSGSADSGSADGEDSDTPEFRIFVGRVKLGDIRITTLNN